MPCFAFFYRQGLFRGQLQRPHIPSITGSILIFSTTLHTSWWLFLLLCGPMLHINMESSCLVSRKAKYNRSRSCLVTSISILNFSEQIWNGILIRFFCPHVCPPPFPCCDWPPFQGLSSRSGLMEPRCVRPSWKMRSRTGQWLIN